MYQREIKLCEEVANYFRYGEIKEYYAMRGACDMICY